MQLYGKNSVSLDGVSSFLSLTVREEMINYLFSQYGIWTSLTKKAFDVILVLTIFLMVRSGAILRSKYPTISIVSTFMECLAVIMTTYTDKMAITNSKHIGTKFVLLIYNEKQRYKLIRFLRARGCEVKKSMRSRLNQF